MNGSRASLEPCGLLDTTSKVVSWLPLAMFFFDDVLVSSQQVLLPVQLDRHCDKSALRPVVRAVLFEVLHLQCGTAQSTFARQTAVEALGEPKQGSKL